MGRSGADVAREAADLVLADDNFATLVRAMAQGRRLYENLRKAVRYYLAVKLALVAVSVAIVASGRPLPFLPVQVLILELFIVLGAAIAFVNQAPEGDEMSRPPRALRARFFDGRMLFGIIAGAITLGLLTGGSFLVAYSSLGVAPARCLALVSWLIGHVSLGIAMGWERRGVTLADLRANPALLIWAGAAIALTILLLGIPPFAALLQVGPIPLQTAAAAVVLSAIVPLWLEIPTWLRRRRAIT
jgi:Ca2+-transporting ATPase